MYTPDLKKTSLDELFKDRLMENIFLAMEHIIFSKKDAAFIVGGPKKLERLIESGQVRAEKRLNVKNAKWFCNAADVLRHCRNMQRVRSDSKIYSKNSK